jgi:hypothetical protein
MTDMKGPGDRTEDREWNERREELENTAQEAALALLHHTQSRACVAPFVHDGFAMIVAAGLPVDVIAAVAEAMRMFVHKHEDDPAAMAVLTGNKGGLEVEVLDEQGTPEGETPH